MRRYTIRNIPDEQYRQLRIMAAEREQSINGLMLDIIDSETTKQEGKTMTKDIQHFIDSGDSRETSPEIMEAIADLAKNPAEAERIWQDPTEEEDLAIWERVTKNGLLPADDFFWGEMGSAWAKDIENQ
jgi:plasmid stability protein